MVNPPPGAILANNTTIYLFPVAGDNQPQIQAAVDFCKTNPGWDIRLTVGTFQINSPIVIASIFGSDYAQVSVSIRGAAWAKNAPADRVSVIQAMFADGPAIAIQKGKCCQIADIAFVGQYTLPNSLTPDQIYRMRYEDWAQSGIPDGRTNANTAIAIDYAFDPGNFDDTYQPYPPLKAGYLVGMSGGGSTAIRITGCCIKNFVVGVVVTPGFCVNGELIDVLDCQIDYCRVVYGYTQAQSKCNRLEDIMCWGNVHTVVDGVHFGRWRGDGSTCPFVDRISIAGAVHQLLWAYAYTFPINIKRVYAEGLLMIGVGGLLAGSSFEGCQIDFASSDDSTVSPDFFYQGFGTTFRDCMLRLYGAGRRIVFNARGTVVEGGSMSLPPMCANSDGKPPQLQNILMYYGTDILNTNNYDDIYLISKNMQIKFGPSASGTFQSQEAVNTLQPGDLLITGIYNVNGVIPGFINTIVNNQVVVGYVSGVAGGVVAIQNIGVAMEEGVLYSIYVAKIKAGTHY